MSEKGRLEVDRFMVGAPVRLAVEEDFYYYVVEGKNTYKRFNVHGFPFYYEAANGLQFSFTRPYGEEDLKTMKQRIREKIRLNQLFVLDALLPGEDGAMLPTYEVPHYK